MQIGESVAVALQLMSDDKCIICGKAHPEPKEDDKIEDTASAEPKSKWGRVSMSGKWDLSGNRSKIFKNGTKPRFSTQGHHCVALSALVKNANTASPSDRRIRLNHYLKKADFYPNRESNCIQLPARTSWGDFKAYFDSLDDDKPLQLHGPGHDESYFAQCDRLLTNLVRILTNPKICEKTPEDDMIQKLKDMVKHAENYSFNRLAQNTGAWQLHPGEQRRAKRLYFLPSTQVMEVYTVSRVKETRSGLGRAKKRLTSTRPGLDEGPFAS